MVNGDQSFELLLEEKHDIGGLLAELGEIYSS